MGVAGIGWLKTRNSQTFEQYLRDQISKNSTLGDITKEFEDKYLSVTEASCNSDYVLSPHTTHTQQIDIAVDNKVYGKNVDSPNKGRKQNKHMANKHCERSIQI